MAITIPVPANIPEGLPEALSEVGIIFWIDPAGLNFPDSETLLLAKELINSYAGSEAELIHWKIKKQEMLDFQLDVNFSFTTFVRNGTKIGITSNDILTFFSTITSNYRTLRENITNASTIAQVQGIDVSLGWPDIL